jgi:hypothetical protein
MELQPLPGTYRVECLTRSGDKSHFDNVRSSVMPFRILTHNLFYSLGAIVYSHSRETVEEEDYFINPGQRSNSHRQLAHTNPSPVHATYADHLLNNGKMESFRCLKCTTPKERDRLFKSLGVRDHLRAK